MCNIVKRKLGLSLFGNAATRHGLQHEGDAFRQYTAKRIADDPLFTVQPLGLVVFGEETFLSCSPEGLVIAAEF